MVSSIMNSVRAEGRNIYLRQENFLPSHLAILVRTDRWM